MSIPTFGLWYDFRNPEHWAQPIGALYRDTIDQAVWSEQLGFGSAWLSEHHFAPDDYASSPLIMAAAIGARTTTLRVATNIVVAALHNPIRLAEDANALSLITDGRFDLGVGLGYNEREFTSFGRVRKQRPSLLEDAIAIIRTAWSGSDAGYEGTRLSMPAVKVTPVAEKTPRMPIGAVAPKGIERAARLGDGVITLSNESIPVYLDALIANGKSLDEGAVYASQWVVVADDPEKEWSRIGENVLYQVNKYIEWGSFEGSGVPDHFDAPDDLLDFGVYQLWDGAKAVDELVSLSQRFPQIRDFHFWAQFPGETVESGSARIQYIADRVIPEVTRQLTAAPVAV
ncbi:LLM class flavin-dependent oxidoreductase [Subtercola frigoramans]|uniref:Alkanesulfonate monooxygenase SsuD/methylene tetrahydromethanopterin reductase-like flavin-dependent oxidoreductase (Luciferase family) n=1 Tax=Subtercola frigoramans TaxID=120298 RepID=A0ABS2L186_9MICO|nr:LLM class flavin-dependent oxidoreductase [Subtercola frigoramans]MBM7470794.1 alkanesulfonate monooxygenase SsuD/methylene tetrahydromethanopterin reductase-like flavin-dependent oxidoreductase (luciferase family) [Subtercola frigoramans]